MNLRFSKAVISAVTASSLLFSACSAAGTMADKQPVTIDIWHVYGAQTDSPLNDLIAEFNETEGAKQGIRVEVTMVSNNKNIHKDIIASANGDPGSSDLPDIFVAYPSTVTAMPDENILVDYRDYFSSAELAEFVPAFLADGEVNGRLVTLPVAKSTELLFVNKTAFDRFAADTGAELEDLTTWEGLYRMAGEYARWTDEQTPDVPDDGKNFFVHDFHFNYFQVGVRSLGEEFFEGEDIIFGSAFKKVWEPYADACLSGGVWLQGGYATEPLRTGESIVSVASSASVLYFSNEVIYADNTTEEIELITMPCPVFEDGSNLVMQRGAGMCTVKSTPEREKAAVTFLKWLTAPENNTRFAVSTGYMPVTQEAFESYLPQEIEGLTEQKYVELYKAYQQTQEGYKFYSAPQLDSYLETETSFEDTVRRCMLSGR
ncbi:MAG: extracellular solute-binding protein, partial [Oscillospiraceae bacterium]|nr:extracellular solute-binding protein [Oscillospiraceae bacterium]